MVIISFIIFRNNFLKMNVFFKEIKTRVQVQQTGYDVIQLLSMFAIKLVFALLNQIKTITKTTTTLIFLSQSQTSLTPRRNGNAGVVWEYSAFCGYFTIS